jgi:hypothetical protein
MFSKIGPLYYFIASLLILILVSFFIHITILESKGYPIYGNKIILSYVINFLLAAGIFISLFLFKTRLKNYIGFLFMGGSLLKFLFFFVLFYPGYNADGIMDKLEFSAFFIPYSICLFLETFYMVRMLNRL